MEPGQSTSHGQALRENCRLGRQLASALEARAAREKRLAASAEYLALAEGQRIGRRTLWSYVWRYLEMVKVCKIEKTEEEMFILIL